jgi:hypothetical protein
VTALDLAEGRDPVLAARTGNSRSEAETGRSGQTIPYEWPPIREHSQQLRLVTARQTATAYSTIWES